MFSTNVFGECLRRFPTRQFQLRNRNDVILTNAFGECLANVFDDFQQRSSNYKVGINSSIFQLRSRNKISDFQSLMPKPTLHPRTLIFLKHRIHRRSVNKVVIEVGASDVIESAHISGKSSCIFLIELFVDVAKGF